MVHQRFILTKAGLSSMVLCLLFSLLIQCAYFATRLRNTMRDILAAAPEYSATLPPSYHAAAPTCPVSIPSNFTAPTAVTFIPLRAVNTKTSTAHFSVHLSRRYSSRRTPNSTLFHSVLPLRPLRLLRERTHLQPDLRRPLLPHLLVVRHTQIPTLMGANVRPLGECTNPRFTDLRFPSARGAVQG